MANTIDTLDQGRVFLKINGVYQHLGKAERRVANFVKNYPEEVIKLPINVFASKIGVSSSTVIRLCKKIDIEGYSDLKLQLAQDLVRTRQDTLSSLEEEGGLPALLNSTRQDLIEAIDGTFQTLSVPDLIEAGNLIQEAHSILVIGTGGSAAVAHLFNYNLIKRGFRSQSSTDFVTIPLLLSQMGSKDVLFAISHSGSTESVDAAVRLAKSLGCKVIGLTNYPESVVAKQSDVVLTTAVVESPSGSEKASIRIAQISVLDVLRAWLSVANQDFL